MVKRSGHACRCSVPHHPPNALVRGPRPGVEIRSWARFGGRCPSLRDDLHRWSRVGAQRAGVAAGWGAGRAGVAVGGSPWPSGQDCGPPGPREPVAQPGCNGARSKAARVPAEPGTILRLCARLLGAEETKRKCQERVNQTRYSVTITSFSGLLGPRAPRAQAGHLRGAHNRWSWRSIARVCR